MGFFKLLQEYWLESYYFWKYFKYFEQFLDHCVKYIIITALVVSLLAENFLKAADGQDLCRYYNLSYSVGGWLTYCPPQISNEQLFFFLEKNALPWNGDFCFFGAKIFQTNFLLFLTLTCCFSMEISNW